MNENSTPSSEVIHLESGVMVFKGTAASFMDKLGADVMFVDFEDGNLRTFTAGDTDWKDVPQEDPHVPKLVPIR